ncbi:MAG: tRNA-dihydrouridine synthase [Patescibacteria group bacterium]
MNFWKKIKKPCLSGRQAILALAPMAGVSDSAFRQVCREYGADVVYTEMVSADGLFYDSKKTLEFLKFNKKEHPVVIQLFGKQSERFTKAAQICEQAGFDGIDINFGCPAKKVAGHGGGVTLMRDLPKCREIIEAVLAGTKLPVSVKLRSSINVRGLPWQTPACGNLVTALDFIKFMKDLPLSAVMIHGRPYENPFNAEIDYEMIKKCVEFIKNNYYLMTRDCHLSRRAKADAPLAMTAPIVLGNGGIKTPEDAKRMLEQTGADGVGLARGLYGRPWLFRQIKDYLKKGKYSNLKLEEIKKIILEHAKLAFENKDKHGIVELRKHLAWYITGQPGARELRAKLVRVEDVKEIKAILKYLK